MASLKGSSFDRQLKDIHHRTSAFNEGRFGKSDHQTHSSALSEKRAEYGRSFAQHCENQGLEGKLNSHMNNETVRSFLEARTDHLSPSSAEGYVRGFSSLLEGLRESNVDMTVDKEVFNDLVKDIKDNAPAREVEDGRAIDNPGEKIEQFYSKSFGSGVMSEIQNELGFRVEEAHKLASDIDRYYNPETGTIDGMIGKHNHEYSPKDISPELVAKIEAIDRVPAMRTYQDHCQQLEVKSHDWRYTYAEREFNDKVSNGLSYEQARSEVAVELNHSDERGEMTSYYLARA